MVNRETHGIDEARGLMAFWADIAPARQRAYQQWHNTEHIPERLGHPGFLFGRRYRDVDDVDRFLMCYDTLGREALVSPEYLEALNQPTPATRLALTWFERPTRNVYSLSAASGRRRASAAPVLIVGRFAAGCAADPGAAAASARSQDAFGWLSGLVRAAVYHVDAAGSQVSTREASIHGARRESAGGVLWIECRSLELLADAALREKVAASFEHWASMHDVTGTERACVYSIDFACRPAGTNEEQR